MTGVNFDDVVSFGSMKEKYSEDKLVQESYENSLASFIRKADDDEVKFDSKEFSIATVMTLPQSYAAITDKEALPKGDLFHEVFAKYSTKLMYASVEGTHFALTRGHSGGRVGPKYIEDLIKNTLLSSSMQVDYDLYGNGRGFRAVIEAATVGATSFIAKKATRLTANMVLDIYDANYTTLKGTIRIAKKSVDRMSKTVSIDPLFGSQQIPAGVIPGDVLVLSGALAQGEPVDGRHMMGLARLTDNTLPVGKLSPLDWYQWSCVNQNAGQGNPTQEMFQLQYDFMHEIASLYPNKGIIHPCQKRQYMSQFLGQRQFTSNSYDTGMSSLSFDAVKMGEDKSNKKPGNFRWLEDKNCDNDTIYFWNDSCLAIASDKYDEFTMADEDGSEMRKRVGFDTEEGFMRYWANTVTGKRNGIGKISNLAVPNSAL